MRFYVGDVSKLVGKPWHILELSNERFVEVYIKRIVHYAVQNFKNDAFELYVPVGERGLDTFEMLESSAILYVRAESSAPLLRIRRLGITGLSTRAGTRDLLTVDDSYIQSLERLGPRDECLCAGDLVSIVDGKYRDFVGQVVSLDGDKVTVELQLFFRLVTHVTYRRNIRATPPPWYWSIGGANEEL